jgi:hypothetical protein
MFTSLASLCSKFVLNLQSASGMAWGSRKCWKINLRTKRVDEQVINKSGDNSSTDAAERAIIGGFRRKSQMDA